MILAALNGLYILACDVQGAYLNVPTKEKVYTIAGPEFGSNVGRPAVIVRAMYGLRTSGARWRDHMAGTLDVKMDLTRKARLVAGGHQTSPSDDMVFFSVVSRDSVRLAFLLVTRAARQTPMYG
jgi:hypothetical protein